jgi:hypothetical protein
MRLKKALNYLILYKILPTLDQLYTLLSTGIKMLLVHERSLGIFSEYRIM